MDLLLEANEKENNRLTIEEIRAETNTFMFAVSLPSELEIKPLHRGALRNVDYAS